MPGLAALLLTVDWRSIYVLLGVAHLVLVPLLIFAIPKTTSAQSKAARPADGFGIAEAARTRQFWLLLGIYAICGLDDFFVTTHVVAFAQDRGADAFLAGNLLALMGLTGLVGLIAAGAFSDRSGPVWPTAIAFVARVAVFALVMVDQSTASGRSIRAGVRRDPDGVTAPLTAVFVAQNFGTRQSGALDRIDHHGAPGVFGGFGAYLGAAVFDGTGTYDIAFAIMLGASVLALVLTAMLRKPARGPPSA